MQRRKNKKAHDVKNISCYFCMINNFITFVKPKYYYKFNKKTNYILMEEKPK